MPLITAQHKYGNIRLKDEYIAGRKPFSQTVDMKYFSIIAALLLTQSVFAQPKLRVLKATSKNVSINDRGFLDKNAWNLLPKARPDIYTADRTRKTKWVAFYTDIDSIRVKVKPATTFNFIILLNSKDSCYTKWLVHWPRA